MNENTWIRGKKHNYTDRPLTDNEREFAGLKENHDLIFKYCKINRLDVSEWYDILVIPYLEAVKKYVTEKPEVQQWRFSTVLFKKFDTAVMNHNRAMHRKKRMPEGGFVSLDYMVEGDNPFAEHKIEAYWIDKKAGVERQVIFNETFKEFYKKCITINDEGNSWVSEYLKKELDLLLERYTVKQVNKKTEELYPYDYNVEDLIIDMQMFRRVFKEVFGW